MRGSVQCVSWNLLWLGGEAQNCQSERVNGYSRAGSSAKESKYLRYLFSDQTTNISRQKMRAQDTINNVAT